MAISILRTKTKDKEKNIDEEPYIGPISFEFDDQKRFFGRDYETDAILSLILAHNNILVYAQSGAGKTSIFNAQILPTLKKLGFEILQVCKTQNHF